MRSHAHCPRCGASALILESAVKDHYFNSPGVWTYRQCTNEACHIGFPDPAPDDETLAAAYSSYYTHDAGPKRAGRILAKALGPLYRRAVAGDARKPGPSPWGWLIEYLRWSVGGLTPSRDGLIVDIGCGNGESFAALSALGWARVAGVEPDPAAVAAGGRDIRFGMAEALPFDSGTVDAALMHHVIEHLRDPKRALDEARRVLKPDGRLTLVTPNIDCTNRKKWGKYWRGFEAPRHLVIFTVQALSDLVRSAGFEIEVARTSARSGSWIDQVSREKATGIPTSKGRAAAARAAWRDHIRQLRDTSDADNSGDEIVLIARKAG